MDRILRGAEEVVSAEDLERKVARSIQTDTPLIIKEGFDPTAPDIHLGHAVTIRKLKHFQELGHTVVFLIGDFTGLVGDPSGRSKIRPRMTLAEVEKNAETYRTQVFKILDPKRTQVRFNSEWLGRLTSYDFLALTSYSTVARMLERDDFDKRYKSQAPIAILEFLYPLLQAYDSVALKADVELGGTDQKFNLLLGRTIQECYEQEPQVCLMMPLLVGTDGVEKMSKSLGNYIGINDSPDEIFGKTMSIPDTLIHPSFKLCTQVPAQELKTIEADLTQGRVNPRDHKRRLANELVTLYYSHEMAREAEEKFDRLFRKKELPDDIKDYVYEGENPIALSRLIARVGGASSGSEARRLIEGGGVQIDGQRVTDSLAQVIIEHPILLKVGKRFFLRVRPKD
ncbi:MAG: tyrosine--tRNA ligase [bacterium]